MNRHFRYASITAIASTCLVLGVSLSEAIEANPYQGISVRNGFSLKPIEVAPVVQPTATAPSSIKLSGIVSFDGVTKALIVIQEGAKSENLPPLGEDEREGQIRVLRIDQEKGEVEIVNGSSKARINFEDNKLAAVAPAPVAGVPGAPGGTNAPGSIKGGLPVPSNLPPSVQSRISSRGETGGFGNRPGGGPGSSGVVPVPTRNVRTPQATVSPETPTHVAPTPQSNLTAAESVVLMEVQREVNKDKVEAKVLPPFPPSPF